jgi:hypothetical protein
MNRVYLPRCDASQGAQTQMRRINLVGLKRRPECGRVGDRGVCKLDARAHAQIMTVDLARGLIRTTDFASIVRANGYATRLRVVQTHRWCCKARRSSGSRQIALPTTVDPCHRLRRSRRSPAIGHESARGCWQPPKARQHRRDAQTPMPATRAQAHIDLRHQRHEGVG